MITLQAGHFWFHKIGKFHFFLFIFLPLFLVIIILAIAVILLEAPRSYGRSYRLTESITSYNLPGIQNPNAIFVRWRYAYIGTNKDNGGPEFFVLDIANPSDPVVVSSYNVDNDINAIYVDNNIAYVATSNNTKELVLLNVKNKTAPQEIGSYNTTGDANGLAVYAVGNVTFVGTQNNSAGNEFYALNTAPSSAIQLLGSYDVGASVNDIDVNGTKAYLATAKGTREFLILNISNPAAITLLAELNVAGTTEATGVAFNHNLLVGVTNNNGTYNDFYLWNVSGPPQLLGYRNLDVNNSDVALYDNIAYISAHDSLGSVFEIDLANPSSPIIRNTYQTGANTNGIAVKDSIIYAATNNDVAEMQVISSAMPQEPRLRDINGDGIVTITCLGDSNTAQVVDTLQSWCTLLGNSLTTITGGAWRTTNQAITGVSMIQYGDSQLAAALDNDKADAIINALGGWDITFLTAGNGDYTWDTIFAKYHELEDTAKARGADTFFVLPTLANADTEFNRAQNNNMLDLHNRLRHEFRQTHIIDFLSPIVIPDDYFDFVHLNQTGHAKVEQEAFREVYNP